MQNDTIVAVKEVDGPCDDIWVAPGLVDLQVNGFAGFDLNTHPLQPETVVQLTEHLWQIGVTEYCPTVITNAPDAIEQAVGVIAEAVRKHPTIGRSIAGIHLEGPFVSPEDGPRGAHDARYVRAPDWPLFEHWQAAAHGLIRLVTLSPEWPEASAFIANCVKQGIKVAIGHTAANTETIAAAVRAGATLSTHLGNGAHVVLPRHPNYIWAQLAEDELWASFIADGFHLPDAVLKVIMRVKGERAFLVSDTVYLGGLPPGEYRTHIGGDVVLRPDGKLHLARSPELLAGSVKPLLYAIKHLVDAGLCSFADAWDMASVRPAAFLGLPAQVGIAEGAPANLILMKQSKSGWEVQEVWHAGVKVYTKFLANEDE